MQSGGLPGRANPELFAGATRWLAVGLHILWPGVVRQEESASCAEGQAGERNVLRRLDLSFPRERFWRACFSPPAGPPALFPFDGGGCGETDESSHS